MQPHDNPGPPEPMPGPQTGLPLSGPGLAHAHVTNIGTPTAPAHKPFQQWYNPSILLEDQKSDQDMVYLLNNDRAQEQDTRDLVIEVGATRFLVHRVYAGHSGYIARQMQGDVSFVVLPETCNAFLVDSMINHWYHGTYTRAAQLVNSYVPLPDENEHRKPAFLNDDLLFHVEVIMLSYIMADPHLRETAIKKIAEMMSHPSQSSVWYWLTSHLYTTTTPFPYLHELKSLVLGIAVNNEENWYDTGDTGDTFFRFAVSLPGFYADFFGAKVVEKRLAAQESMTSQFRLLSCGFD